MLLQILKIFFAPEVVIPPLVIGLIIAPFLYRYLQRRRSQILVAPGIGRSSWFTVSGSSSTIYYDIDKASSDLESLECINKWYIDNVQEIRNKVQVDYLAFMEREDGPVGAITKKDKISSELCIPSFIVRPRRRIRASRLKGVRAEELCGRKVVIISDVATTGRSVRRIVDILKEYDAQTVGVVTIVYRHDQGDQEDLKTSFKKNSIEFRYADDNLVRYQQK
jgi:orotate phosphoribosyltransferase